MGIANIDELETGSSATEGGFSSGGASNDEHKKAEHKVGRVGQFVKKIEMGVTKCERGRLILVW